MSDIQNLAEAEAETQKVRNGLLFSLGASCALIGAVWVLHFIFGG